MKTDTTTETPFFTRQQYLAKECDHKQYYAQFVTPYIIAMVTRIVGRKKLAASKDPHLNDIPLAVWDSMVPHLVNVGAKMQKRGDFLTLAGGVCVLKEAAKQAMEAANNH
jgi:hypothetical protein